MKPKPLSSLNHFTVPVLMRCTSADSVCTACAEVRQSNNSVRRTRRAGLEVRPEPLNLAARRRYADLGPPRGGVRTRLSAGPVPACTDRAEEVGCLLDGRQ